MISHAQAMLHSPRLRCLIFCGLAPWVLAAGYAVAEHVLDQIGRKPQT